MKGLTSSSTSDTSGDTSGYSLGYSPCPNDTFIFYALVHGKINTGGIVLKETLLDVETLNKIALRSGLDVTKVSTHAFGSIRDDYCLLRSGGALGKKCGPLLVVRKPCGFTTTLSPGDLRGKRIAIPGSLTTALLLLKLFDPMLGENAVEMRFDLIPRAVRDGDVDAGLIIHESRFTYGAYGLSSIIDLGAWWESETGLPIPLGSIAARRSLGGDIITRIDNLIRESVLYGRAQGARPPAIKGARPPAIKRAEALEYIKAHARELDETVIARHIELYVNDYTLDIGDEGTRAVEELLRRAEEKGIIHKSLRPIFFE